MLPWQSKSDSNGVQVSLLGDRLEVRHGTTLLSTPLVAADIESLGQCLQTWLKPWLENNAPQAQISVRLSAQWYLDIPVPASSISLNANEYRDFCLAYTGKLLDVPSVKIEIAWTNLPARTNAYVVRSELLGLLRDCFSVHLVSIQPALPMGAQSSQPLYVDFQMPFRNQTSKWAWTFCFFAALLCCASLFEYWTSVKKVDALQLEQRQLAKRIPVPKSSTKSDGMTGKTEQRIGALIGFSWKQIFDALEVSSTPSTRIIDMSHDAGTGLLKISLEATSSSAIFDFINRLEKNMPETKPRLISQQQIAPDKDTPAGAKALIGLQFGTQGLK